VHRLFFALWPDHAVRAAVQAQTRALLDAGVRGRLMRADRYHLTLRFIGGYAEQDAARLAALCRAGDAVNAAVFDLSLNRAGWFERPRVAWFGPTHGGEALDGLRCSLEGALVDVGIAPEQAPFVPHVTVLRNVRADVPQLRCDAIPWRVDAFALVESAEAGYTVVKRWALG